MLILPFIHNIINNSTFKVNTIKFLTIGGKFIWEEKNNLDINLDILNPNDIYTKIQPINFDKKLQLCEVDTQKTIISEFYRWEEINIEDTDTFCWRTYYYLTNADDICWLNIPENEKLGSYKVKDLIQSIVLKK
jgi:hypothetical protein